MTKETLDIFPHLKDATTRVIINCNKIVDLVNQHNLEYDNPDTIAYACKLDAQHMHSPEYIERLIIDLNNIKDNPETVNLSELLKLTYQDAQKCLAPYLPSSK
ncbi:MAG: hypothetical protein WC438_03045 [Candidatus Pacearchaeota archaeon]